MSTYCYRDYYKDKVEAFEEIMKSRPLTHIELSQYEESLKNFRDWNSVIKTAEMKGEARGRAEGHAEGRAEGRAEGLAEGRAEGIEEGEHKKAITVAKKLKFLGISIELIIESSGLSREEIDDL